MITYSLYFAFTCSSPEACTVAEYVEAICQGIDLSINLGVKVYPTIWALLIFRRILTA